MSFILYLSYFLRRVFLWENSLILRDKRKGERNTNEKNLKEDSNVSAAKNPSARKQCYYSLNFFSTY